MIKYRVGKQHIYFEEPVDAIEIVITFTDTLEKKVRAGLVIENGAWNRNENTSSLTPMEASY